MDSDKKVVIMGEEMKPNSESDPWRDGPGSNQKTSPMLCIEVNMTSDQVITFIGRILKAGGPSYAPTGIQVNNLTITHSTVKGPIKIDNSRHNKFRLIYTKVMP